MAKSARWVSIVRIALLTVALSAFGCGKNGGGDNNGETNNGGGVNNVPEGECTVDEDCPAASEAEFLHPENVVCTESAVRGAYCSECINDAQCQTGEACRDATYCFTLSGCQKGADCSDNPGEVHQACIAGFCKDCIDDADCEMDEVCYSRRCATRSTVDPTCIDASCEGPCEITYGGDGAPTGIACM